MAIQKQIKMKNKLFLLLLVVITFFCAMGCGKPAKLKGSIIQLGKCQYAIYNSDNGVSMCHAGDCNNASHVQYDRVAISNEWEIYLKREQWDAKKVKAFKEAFESIYGKTLNH